MPKYTKPESIMAEDLSRLNLFFRPHDYRLPGRPDFVLEDVRIAVFVHGCYQHRHSGCSRSRSPKSNSFVWMARFWDTVARDQKNVAALTAAGWWVFVAWECELYANHLDVSTRLLQWYQRRLARLQEGFSGNERRSTEILRLDSERTD